MKSQTERIITIDILRGFALLGLLLMNVMSFSMPDIAYYNPTSFGDEHSLNRIIYGLVHLVADQKFMALFSLLFGSSVMLLLNKLESRNANVAKVHYTRNFWLLIIGLAHGILIWNGDVLLIYALAAFVLFFFRRVKPEVQFGVGLAVFLLPVVASVVVHFILPSLDSASVQSLEAYWNPTQAVIDKDVVLYQGEYIDQLLYRLSGESEGVQTAGKTLLEVTQLIEFFARSLGMMLMGMALYTWGVLTAKLEDNFYRWLSVIGFSVGIPLILLGLWQFGVHQWSAEYSLFLGRVPNHLATPFMATGYIGLITLWSRRSLWTRLQSHLAAVGQMALTNYVGQSILASFIFYGFGLGFYGQVSRLAQLGIVFAVCMFQLVVSNWWLSHFRFGPLEWLWRSVTYWQWQPLLKRQLVKEA